MRVEPKAESPTMPTMSLSLSSPGLNPIRCSRYVPATACRVLLAAEMSAARILTGVSLRLNRKPPIAIPGHICCPNSRRATWAIPAAGHMGETSELNASMEMANLEAKK